jgi:hypothetical protein
MREASLSVSGVTNRTSSGVTPHPIRPPGGKAQKFRNAHTSRLDFYA